MVLKPDKERMSVYIDTDLKGWLTQESKNKNRSMSNYVEWILNELKKKGVVKVEK